MQAGSWKSGFSGGCAIAQKDLMPPSSSITAVSPYAHGSGGKAETGIAASKISTDPPRRGVQTGGRSTARSAIPAR